MEVYLKWIVNAWETLSTDLIKKSFKICGITVTNDGTEDQEIHCFKNDGTLPGGLAALKQARTDAELDAASDILAGIDLGAEEEEIDKENAENFDEEDSENEIVFA